MQLDTVKKVLKLVYSRGIDKKVFLKAADKALVDLDKSGEPQGKNASALWPRYLCQVAGLPKFMPC